MLNPSYLIKSRHDIYYFRYPLPLGQRGKSNRVSISLKTRCPRQALRFARVLEYHSVNLITRMDLDRMDHADIMSLFKGYYAEVLERARARIDADGPLPEQNIKNITKHLKEMDALIEDGSDDMYELLGLDVDNPEDSLVHKDLQPIMDKYELDFAPDTKEYAMMKKAYKYVRRNYCHDLMAYNSQVMDYSLLGTRSGDERLHLDHHKPVNQLSKVIKAYLDENSLTIGKRALNEQRDCLRYLTDLLGEDYPVTKMNNVQVQDVKRHLLETPKNRNKGKLTAGCPLLEQITIAKDNELPMLGSTSVNCPSSNDLRLLGQI